MNEVMVDKVIVTEATRRVAERDYWRKTYLLVLVCSAAAIVVLISIVQIVDLNAELNDLAFTFDNIRTKLELEEARSNVLGRIVVILVGASVFARRSYLATRISHHYAFESVVMSVEEAQKKDVPIAEEPGFRQAMGKNLWA